MLLRSDGARVKLKRMWVNQPSTLQPLHKWHGTNVLAYEEYDGTTRVYFLTGDVISMQMLTNCLSEGWRICIHCTEAQPRYQEKGMTCPACGAHGTK